MELKQQLARHHSFFAQGETKNLAFRSKRLKLLYGAIRQRETKIEEALKKDLNKAPFEAYACEIGLVYEELHCALRGLPGWAKEKRAQPSFLHFPASAAVVPEPYGTVLIMAPWNYPFLLTMAPLISAVAAGNCAVLKPSAYAPHTAAVIEEIVTAAFQPCHVSVVQGGREENTALLGEKFDYIFFTGSPAVGKVVMHAAAEHLTPVTLELGGKSPCIVDETANIRLAAKRIIWGKCLNAGQTCIAPDYLFCHASVKKGLVEEMKKAIVNFYGTRPEENETYPAIINQKHFKRLCGLMQQGNVLAGGYVNEKTRQIAPTLLDGLTGKSPVMQEEIFGPLLPVFTYQDIEEVYRFIEKRPKPLAFYLFTRSKARAREAARRLSFGGGCINDTVIHIANTGLPFGGVGESGMGQYHGKAGFDTFTHKKSIVKRGNWPDIPLRYPPYKKQLSLLKKLMK